MAGTQREATVTTSLLIEKLLHAIRPADIPGCGRVERGRDARRDVPNGGCHATAPTRSARVRDWWLADPGPLRRAGRYPVEGGSAEVIEYPPQLDEKRRAPHAGNHMHVLTVRDDRIVSDMVFCGGSWPDALLAEMEAGRWRSVASPCSWVRRTAGLTRLPARREPRWRGS